MNPVKETPPPERHTTAAERLAAYARLVDFVSRRRDRECVLLGAMGFSTSYIMSKCSLTQGQVGYRLNKAGIYRAEFRNGSSVFAKTVLSTARDVVDAKLEQHLVKHVPNLYEVSKLRNSQAA